MSMDDDLAEWAVWMRSDGLADRTIEERVAQLTRIARKGVDIYQPTPDALAAFLANPAWKPATRRAYYSALRAWFLWRVRTNRQEDNPLETLRAPRVPRTRSHQRVGKDDIGVILAACHRRRARAMVLLAAYQGLRVHEIAKMRGELIYSGRLRVIGKGGVDSEIPLHPLIGELAQEFPRRGYWFPSYSRPGEPITAQNVSAVLGKLLKRAGIEASGHGLRHWFGAQTLRSSGGNLRVAQEALRHASPATTAIYTNIDEDDLRHAIEGLPGPTAA